MFLWLIAFDPSNTQTILQKNNDSECVVVHDDIWCSLALDSNESKIMKQYAEFYFSDDYENLLVKSSSQLKANIQLIY